MAKNCQTTAPFTFRLSEPEREQLKILAKDLDISQGAFIRAKSLMACPLATPNLTL